MSDTEAREAYHLVDILLPNGQTVRGRSIPWRQAIELMVVKDGIATDLAAGILTPAVVAERTGAMLEDFGKLSGLTEADLLAACPDLSLPEVWRLLDRFFWAVREPPRPATRNGGSPAA